MINRTKLAALASCAALAAALLTGCGGSSSSAAPSSVSTASVSAPASSAAASADTTENGSDALDAAYNTLLQANPISNQFEIAAMNIEYDFGLPADDVVSYKGVKSNDNGDAGLVLVIEAADGKAEDIAGKLQAGPGGLLRQLRRVRSGTDQRAERHRFLQRQPRGHGDCFQRVHRGPVRCRGQRPERLNKEFPRPMPSAASAFFSKKGG